VPQWYRLLTAAKYLGVPPWDLAEKPVWWMNIALGAKRAEESAKQAHQRREANRSAHRGRT
jgi:hypothetical protein